MSFCWVLCFSMPYSANYKYFVMPYSANLKSSQCLSANCHSGASHGDNLTFSSSAVTIPLIQWCINNPANLFHFQLLLIISPKIISPTDAWPNIIWPTVTWQLSYLVDKMVRRNYTVNRTECNRHLCSKTAVISSHGCLKIMVLKN